MYDKSYEEIQRQWKEMTESLTSQAKPPREGESVQHRDYLTNLIMNTRVGFVFWDLVWSSWRVC